MVVFQPFKTIAQLKREALATFFDAGVFAVASFCGLAILCRFVSPIESAMSWKHQLASRNYWNTAAAQIKNSGRMPRQCRKHFKKPCESALLRRLWLEAVSVARGGAAAVNACRRRRRLLAKGGGHYLVFYDARAPGSEAAWRGGIVKLGTNTRVSTSIAGVAVARQGDSVFAGTSGLGGCFTGNSRR